MAAGQMVDGYPYICGGRRNLNDNFEDKCYKITPQSAFPLSSLATARAYSSAAVFNNALFITGGYHSLYGVLNSTEYISESNQQNGPDVPIETHSHCVIQINANEILLTGGFSSGM